MYSIHLSLWTVIAWIVAGVWVAVIGIFVRGYLRQSSLRPLGRLSGNIGDCPRLTVVVAARNESECIETCIRTLLRQDYPNLEIIAVNDRSTDDTGAILDRLSAEFSSLLQVIHVTTLPSGWFGKPHALTAGLQRATGSILFFTDADCEFQAPSTLRTAVMELERRQLDIFTIAARYTMTSLRECVVVPCCSELAMTWLRPERVDDPRWPDAFCNGAFLMARRSSFDKIGGWWSVKTKITEDLELARLAKRSGLRVGVGNGEGFYQTRAYASARDSWNGWSRIFKGVLSPAQLVITLARMMILFVLPLTVVASEIFRTLSTGRLEWPTAAVIGFAIALSLRCTLDLMMFRAVGAPIRAVVLAPLGRLFVMAVCLRALFSHAGLAKTHWRGASFCAGQLVIPRQVKSGSQIQ
jgi:cellulose synthase/poly-beta-1,6-N-acetylglucosamine synthase-like glycosyltransferase